MGRFAGCVIALVSSVACGLDDPAPLVTMTITADLFPAGPCPTPPGQPGECPQVTEATVTLRETEGISAGIHDLTVLACTGGACRPMTYVPVPGDPPPGTTIAPGGTQSRRYRETHASSSTPDVVRGVVTVLTPEGNYATGATFAFPRRE